MLGSVTSVRSALKATRDEKKKTFEYLKPDHFGSWVNAQIFLWPAMRFEFCTPDLNDSLCFNQFSDFRPREIPIHPIAWTSEQQHAGIKNQPLLGRPQDWWTWRDLPQSIAWLKFGLLQVRPTGDPRFLWFHYSRFWLFTLKLTNMNVWLQRAADSKNFI